MTDYWIKYQHALTIKFFKNTNDDCFIESTLCTQPKNRSVRVSYLAEANFSKLSQIRLKKRYCEEMKWYLAPVSVALILLLSSPGHQKEQRSGSSRREGSGTPRREDSVSLATTILSGSCLVNIYITLSRDLFFSSVS